jgi:FkbM family methyltransferase
MLGVLEKVARRLRKRRTRGIRFEPTALEGYYSQFGQDKWIAERLLPGLRDGVFVDIGAYDGVKFSNTLFLETKLGWNGIAIEPVPEVFERLKTNRHCITVNGCVGSPPGGRKFGRVRGNLEMLSGLIAEYDPQHEARISRDLAKEGGSIEVIDVDCFEFNELLDRHGIKHVDYLTVDVEGGEGSIIRSIDFSRFEISVIGIENNYGDDANRKYLSKRGYKFHSRVGDDFFVAT